MNNRVSDTTYTNLIDDILGFDIKRITSVDTAQDFIDRVTALLDFINENKRFATIKRRVLSTPALVKLDSQLKQQRDIVLLLTSHILDDLKQFVLKNGVKLVNADDVRQKVGSSVAITNVETVSLYLDMIRRNYVVVNRHALYQLKEMSDYLHHLIDTVDTFGMGNPISEERLRRFDFAVHDTNVLLETFKRRQRQSGVTAFESLESIWLAYKNNNEFMASDFFTTPLGSYLGIHTDPGIGDVAEVQKNAHKIIDATKLFNNKINEQRLAHDSAMRSVFKSGLKNGITYLVGNILRRYADGIIGILIGVALAATYHYIFH